MDLICYNMYDFVLYNEKDPDANINKLWYLIAYIQAIVLEIQNPFEFIAHVRERNLFKKLYVKLNFRLTTIDYIFAHLGSNQRSRIHSNIVINNKPIISRFTLYNEPLSSDNVTTPAINGYIHVSFTDQEFLVNETKNSNIFVKPLFRFIYNIQFPVFKLKVILRQYIKF